MNKNKEDKKELRKVIMAARTILCVLMAFNFFYTYWLVNLLTVGLIVCTAMFIGAAMTIEEEIEGIVDNNTSKGDM